MARCHVANHRGVSGSQVTGSHPAQATPRGDRAHRARRKGFGTAPRARTHTARTCKRASAPHHAHEPTSRAAASPPPMDTSQEPQLRTQSRTPPQLRAQNVPAGGTPSAGTRPAGSSCVRCCGTDLAAHDPRDRSAHALGAAAATVSPNCVRRIVLRGQLGSRVSPIEPAGSFCVRCCGTELGHGSPREGGGPRPLGAASASPHSGAVQGGVSVDAASASPRSGTLRV